MVYSEKKKSYIRKKKNPLNVDREKFNSLQKMLQSA